MGCQGGEEGDDAPILGQTVQARPHPTHARNQQPCDTYRPSAWSIAYNTHRPQVQLNLSPKMAEVFVELQVEMPQRRKLPWMEAADDTPSGNLLITAAPALVTESSSASAASAARGGAMAGTEAEPAEAAEFVQARSPPLLHLTHACSHTLCAVPKPRVPLNTVASGAQEVQDHNDRRRPAPARRLPARGL